MIRHIVLFKFSETFTPDMRAQWIQGLDAMKGNIPGMASLIHGADVMKTERSWDYAIIADFDSPEALSIYNTHPLHEAIKPLSLPNVKDLAYVDFEIDEAWVATSR
ncbi:Dabb family protein [Pseudoglutamicibacter cumminsii]|uniref:Dabb family protein n=1 Tax=Pseudoglutamicibacter cumminsii TaxID=156979 RepID=UPI0021A6D4D1|nr:Dabb family protein [Pseudoglutamicibacter cumminsii]